MNTGIGRSLSVCTLFAAVMAALLLVPMVSQAQTIFGSGGDTNSVPAVNNFAFGFNALKNNVGSDNTALGYSALYLNTVGSYNTATGFNALNTNASGNYNTSYGFNALYANNSGNYNAANGAYALVANTTGSNNVGNGYQSLYMNTIGSNNIANGSYSLYSNETGNYNTACGLFALYLNQSGNANIGIGYRAGQNILGGSNNIAIGNTGFAADNGIIRIGTPGTQRAIYLAGINGVSSGGVAVYINPNGQLGTLTSSERFKYDIHSMGIASDKLMDLRPVTFRYKQEEDGTHPIQYGLIAEEVAKVYPNLVQYDKDGKPFTVYYHLLTPMMLNELQKAHQRSDAQGQELKVQGQKLEAQEAEISALRSELTSLRQALEQKQGSEVKSAKQSSTPFAIPALALLACVAAAFAITGWRRPSK